MKKISLQWRITLLTALLILCTCIILNMLIYYSGSLYIDKLGYYIIDYIPSDENELIIDGYEESYEESYEEFYEDFPDQITEMKQGFSFESWIITLIVTLISSTIAYFVSGKSLCPLRKLSTQIEDIQVMNLSNKIFVSNKDDEIGKLAKSFNNLIQRLDKAFTIQRQFTANAAHELRTPLAVLQAKLDVYKKIKNPSKEEQVDTMNMVLEQTEKLSLLIKVLLDMTELQSIERTDYIILSELVEEVLFDLSHLADKKQITLHQNDGKANIIGSDILIYRSIYNLVENAIKYNRFGGNVTVDIENKDNVAVITIIDTGCGIKLEDQEKIFNPFYRVDKSRSRAMGGAGLGLALVKDIVQLHGGTVQVVESTDEGTKISIFISTNLS